MSEKQVRVLLANGPRLMRELVRAVLAEQSDIDVIGEVENNSELATAIEQSRPDVLIIGLDENVAAHCGFLIGQYPRLKILALAPEQNRGLLYWAVVEFRTKPVESSEAGLLGALREHPCLGTVHQ